MSGTFDESDRSGRAPIEETSTFDAAVEDPLELQALGIESLREILPQCSSLNHRETLKPRGTA